MQGLRGRAAREPLCEPNFQITRPRKVVHSTRVPMLINNLYLAVIPLVHLGTRFGLTEQVMTLFPDSNFATLFHPDEVDNYIQLFQNRAESYLKGGNVISYEFQKEIVPGTGLVRVQVIQHVA